MSPFQAEGTVYRFSAHPPRRALVGPRRRLPNDCQVSADLAGLVARGRFGHRAVPRGKVVAEILGFARPLTTADLLEALKAAGREPCGPAELLGLAIACPDAMRRERNVAAVAGIVAGDRVPFLWGSVCRRGVGYSLPMKVWQPGDGVLVRV